MPKSVLKSIQTCFEHVLRQTFRKIFAQFSMECRVFENFRKKNIFKIPKMPKSVPKSIQTCFELVLGQIFRKIFMPSVPWRAEFSKIFEKKIFSKFQKCPKVFSKVSKLVLNMFCGKLFEKFLPSFPWNVKSSKLFKKIKKFAKFQKCPKSFPKVSKRVSNLFWVKFFEKNFCPVFHGGSSLRKFSKKYIFKIRKMPKSVPKSIQTCFRVIFSKKIYAQCSMEGRVFENFQKNQKIFTIPKMPKIVPKSMQTCFEHVLGQNFEKFLPSFPWNVESSKIFKKIYLQNSKNAQKCSQKYPNVF